jgi:Zn-finger protein
MVNCEYYPCHFEGQDCTWCYCPFYPCLDPATGGRYKLSARKGKVWSCVDCHWVHREKASRAIQEKLMGKKLSRKELQRLRAELMEGEDG